MYEHVFYKVSQKFDDAKYCFFTQNLVGCEYVRVFMVNKFIYSSNSECKIKNHAFHWLIVQKIEARHKGWLTLFCASVCGQWMRCERPQICFIVLNNVIDIIYCL